LAIHNTGVKTTYEMMKHYQKYETASISSKLMQDILLMAGAEDHYVPVHQNHCQVGNMGLAFRVIIDWMTGLGPIEGHADVQFP
jgi:hypothetical protein